MLFNSIEFLIFLPTVFILYWFVFNNKLRDQNIIILISSYFFYGWWDFRFLSLILISTIVDYFVGYNIPKQSSQRIQKILLYVSVLINIGILGFFKYYNFFVDSWVDLFTSIGYELKSQWTLNIILPVGISFYTFQTMSYTIDIYRKKLEPTKDFISFASFVSFFPQLVAGPIERASNLLPQILKKREFKYEQAVQGLRLIFWGMFKKIVIADQLAPIVDEIFSNYNDLGGGCFSWEHFILHFKSIVILVDILILQLELQSFSDLKLCLILSFHISQEILENFGGAGIYHFQHGLEIIYIYLLEVRKRVSGNHLETY